MVRIGVDAEPRRNVDVVVDRDVVFGCPRLDDLAHQLAEVELAARRGKLPARAIGQRRLTELDRAIERRDQTRRQSLGKRIGDRREAIRDQLRGAQDVAQVMIDARNRHAEFGQPLALRQLMGERPLHDGERRLGAADLVSPPGRRDHPRRVLGTLAEGDDVGREPAHRLKHHAPQRRPQTRK